MRSSPGLTNWSRSNVLLIVKLLVPSVSREQFVVGSAFDYLAAFHYQNLIGAANGREAVRDDERGAAMPQRAQTFLDQRLAFAVEAGGCFVEDQQRGLARIARAIAMR